MTKHTALAVSDRADFAAVLHKPFELEALLTTVATVPNGSDAGR